MEKFCQSCARPLKVKNQNIRGTESDGSLSEKYCNQCYNNGKFIEPNITYEQMLKRGIDGIEKEENNRIKRYVFKKFYPKMLKKVSRFNK